MFVSGIGPVPNRLPYYLGDEKSMGAMSFEGNFCSQ
jgi:hypothetical protein